MTESDEARAQEAERVLAEWTCGDCRWIRQFGTTRAMHCGQYRSIRAGVYRSSPSCCWFEPAEKEPPR